MEANLSIFDKLRAKTKYEEISDDELKEVIEDASYLYCRLRNRNIPESSEEFTFNELNWIKRASVEFLEKFISGIPHGVTKYSENGYSVEFDNSVISKELINEVVPLVGVILDD